MRHRDCIHIAVIAEWDDIKPHDFIFEKYAMTKSCNG